MSGSTGLNLDCGDVPSPSKDVNMNTVMTQPTPGDYAAAVLSAALSFLYAWGLNKLPSKFFPNAEKIADNVVGKALEEILLTIIKQAAVSISVALAQTIGDMINSRADDGSWWGDPGAIGTGKVTAAVQKLIDGEPSGS